MPPNASTSLAASVETVLAAGEQADAGASLCERVGNGPPDAGRGARDDHDLAIRGS